MKKIIIIGCPGAGKSTFARALHTKTGLPLFYLDMLWHKADKTTVTREEFDQKLNDILSQSSWIIDGNYQRTLEKRLASCDTVFLLDFPKEVCLEGVTARAGKPREDMPWYEERLDEDLRKFIESFTQTELPRIHNLLSTCKSKNIIIFKSREETNDYLKDL